MPYFLLAAAILCEVVATSALNASAGFSKLIPTIGSLLMYGVAFYCLAIALKSIPVGVVYAIWSGVGIVLISLVGFVVFKQRLDMAAISGMALIIAGVLVIHLFSKSALN